MKRTSHLLWLLSIAVFASGCASAPKPPASADRAANNAAGMVGKPYHYGGNHPQTGFDCSGLVQWSYAREGVRLAHGTEHLRRASKSISLRSARAGDLLFFTQLGKGSSHVAIYLGEDRFVHAPSTGKNVYVAKLTDPYWKKHFDEARRLDVD
jgi:cell wall-associated NlpC family hydrolase